MPFDRSSVVARSKRQLQPSMLLGVLVVALTALAPAAAQQRQSLEPTDKPFLWKIDGPAPSYLYGTIHVPDDRVLKLPAVVKKALRLSDAFYAEIPLDKATMTSAARKMMLPGDKTLKDVLPAELYERTDRYMKSKGFSIQPFSKLKVWALAAQLALLDYIREMGTKPALDVSLWGQARARKKELGGLETLDEQVAVFDSFSEKEHVVLLTKTLDQLEEAAQKGEDPIRKLVNAYLLGDENNLLKLMNEYLDLDDPLDRRIYDKLITRRNQRMAQRIIRILKNDPGKSHFFAIGAGHLGGERGVVALLEKNRLRLQRLTPEDAAKLRKP